MNKYNVNDILEGSQGKIEILMVAPTTDCIGDLIYFTKLTVSDGRFCYISLVEHFIDGFLAN